jgi:hypothetical protein
MIHGKGSSSATFSRCRRYRYTLWRQWHRVDSAHCKYAMFIGLNPSTADEVRDDPTVRRCIGFAKAWGFDALCMTNLFAYRATDPQEMLAQADPVGPRNNRHLVDAAARAQIVVAAWGAHGIHRRRAARVTAMLPALHYLTLTKAGQPGHPLYLRSDLQPVPWARQAAVTPSR